MIEVPRDRWKRPLIIPRGGGKPVAYQRASSIGSILENTYHLERWKCRLVATAVARSPELAIRVAAAGDNKGALNEVVEDAIREAGGDRASNTGTALHGICEMHDRGTPPSFVPPDFQKDYDAYCHVTRDIEWFAIEQFVVCDELKVAGTPDRIGMLHAPLTFGNDVTLPEGWIGVFDIKTGSVDYPHGFSVQLGTYAHSETYDPSDGSRQPLPGGPSTDHGVLIHLPSGQGKCEFHLLDIASGWQAAKLALEVDKWRKRKNLVSDVKVAQ